MFILIHDDQAAFIKDKIISDNDILAGKLIEDYAKIDVIKAFDHLNRELHRKLFIHRPKTSSYLRSC